MMLVLYMSGLRLVVGFIHVFASVEFCFRIKYYSQFDVSGLLLK